MYICIGFNGLDAKCQELNLPNANNLKYIFFVSNKALTTISYQNKKTGKLLQ